MQWCEVGAEGIDHKLLLDIDTEAAASLIVHSTHHSPIGSPLSAPRDRTLSCSTMAASAAKCARISCRHPLHSTPDTAKAALSCPRTQVLKTMLEKEHFAALDGVLIETTGVNPHPMPPATTRLQQPLVASGSTSAACERSSGGLRVVCQVADPAPVIQTFLMDDDIKEKLVLDGATARGDASE